MFERSLTCSALSSPPAVQRGFATTSVASKKVDKSKEEPEKENAQAGAAEPTAAEAAAPAAEDGGKPKDDWEDEKSSEELALQELVERLHEKGEKEVSRILKVCPSRDWHHGHLSLTAMQAIGFDKRLASSFPKLEINQDIRDRVLQLALQEEAPGDECE